MAINEEIRKQLPKEAIIFDSYAYDNSIIGTTLDGRIIYCFETMVEELMIDGEMTEIEAIEWIECNTIRALLYVGDKAPLIVHMY